MGSRLVSGQRGETELRRHGPLALDDELAKGARAGPELTRGNDRRVDHGRGEGLLLRRVVERVEPASSQYDVGQRSILHVALRRLTTSLRWA